MNRPEVDRAIAAEALRDSLVGMGQCFHLLAVQDRLHFVRSPDLVLDFHGVFFPMTSKTLSLCRLEVFGQYLQAC